MDGTFAERIGMAFRMIVPYSLIILLFLMNVIAAPPPLSYIFKAPFFLMALYYWTVYRPTVLPVWAIFIFGLMMDVLGYFPLGVNALLFVLCRIVIYDQRKYLMAQSFQMNWLGFMMMNIAYQLTLWICYSALKFHFMPVSQLWMPLVFGALFYPVTSVLLHATHKILPAAISKRKGNLGSQRNRLSL